MPKKDIDLPSYLFFGNKEVDNSAAQPTGDVDIDAALNGDKSCWIDESATSNLEKKTVIIDLTDPNKAEALIQILQKNGFTIMFPDACRNLCKLNEDILPIINDDISWEFENETVNIIPSAGRSGSGADLFDSPELNRKPRSEVIIINDQNLSGILTDMSIKYIDEFSPYLGSYHCTVQLKTSEVFVLRVGGEKSGDCDKHIEDANKIIEDAQPTKMRYVELVMNQVDHDKAPIKIPESVDNLSLSVDYGGMRNLIKNESLNLVSPNLISLTISKKISDVDLFELLKRCTNLKSLNLINGFYIEGNECVKFSDLKLDNLEALNIGETAGNSKFNELIDAAKNLKRLSANLEDSRESVFAINKSTKKLKTLKKLSLNYTQSGLQMEMGVCNSLFFAPSISEFVVRKQPCDKYKNENNNYNKRAIVLEYVVGGECPKEIKKIKIDVPYGSFYHSYAKILQNCPKLESLYINDVVNCFGEINKSSLKHTNMSLGDAKIDGLKSVGFRIGNENIKSVAYNDIDKEMRLFDQYEGVSIDLEDGASVNLPSSNKITNLRISSNGKFQTVVVPDDINLSNLRVLKITNCAISLNGLVRILNSATNLSDLRINFDELKLLKNEGNEKQIKLNKNALIKLKTFKHRLSKVKLKELSGTIGLSVPKSCKSFEYKYRELSHYANFTKSSEFPPEDDEDEMNLDDGAGYKLTDKAGTDSLYNGTGKANRHEMGNEHAKGIIEGELEALSGAAKARYITTDAEGSSTEATQDETKTEAKIIDLNAASELLGTKEGKPATEKTESTASDASNATDENKSKTRDANGKPINESETSISASEGEGVAKSETNPLTSKHTQSEEEEGDASSETPNNAPHNTSNDASNNAPHNASRNQFQNTSHNSAIDDGLVVQEKTRFGKPKVYTQNFTENPIMVKGVKCKPFFNPPTKYIGKSDFSQNAARLIVFNEHATVHKNEAGGVAFVNRPELKTQSQCIQSDVKFTDEKEIVERHGDKDSECFSVSISVVFEKGEITGIPLPAMSTGDKITHLALECDGVNLDENDFKIMYSEDFDQYVLFALSDKYSNKDISVKYLIKPNREKINEILDKSTEYLGTKVSKIKNKELQKMIMHASSFKVRDVEWNIDGIDDITKEVVERLWNEKSGNCLHRCTALHYKIMEMKDSGVKSRVCNSSGHQWIEINEPKVGTWSRFDIGGGIFKENLNAVKEVGSESGRESGSESGRESDVEAGNETGAKILGEIGEKKDANQEKEVVEKWTEEPLDGVNGIAEVKRVDAIEKATQAEKTTHGEKATQSGQPEQSGKIEQEEESRTEPLYAECKSAEDEGKNAEENELSSDQYNLLKSEFGGFDVWKGTSVTEPDQLIEKLEEEFNVKGHSRVLLTCSSQKQISQLRSKLLDTYASRFDEREETIDNPNQLTFPLATFVDKNNEIEVKDRTEGGFYKFVVGKNGEKMMIVNWSNFNAAKTLQCNSILDADPMLEGESLRGIKIISLQNIASPSAYLGEDFMSRHQSVVNIANNVEFDLLINNNLVDLNKLEGDHVIVDLKYSPQWKTALCGVCTLNGNKAIWKKGKLVDALESNRDIVIVNAPKIDGADEAVRAFIEDIKRNGFLEVHGKRFPVDPKIKISFAESKDIVKTEDIRSVAEFKPKTPSETDICIHNGTFSQLKEICHIDENGNAITEMGLMERNKGGTLAIRVSAPLSNVQWSDIVKMAKEHNVKLEISVDRKVKLPFKLNEEELCDIKSNFGRNKVITSNDVGYTLEKIKQQSEDTLFVDVSEIKNHNLIFSVGNETHFDEDGCKFKFSVTNGAVTKALLEGRNVCMYGAMNDNLISDISSVFASGTININGNAVKTAGALTILPNKDVPMHVDDCQNISAEDKILMIKNLYGDKADKITLPIAQSNSFRKLAAFARSDRESIEDIWEDLSILQNDAKSDGEEIKLDAKSVSDVVNKFNKERLDSVKNELARNRAVFVVGVAGTGKTTLFNESEELRKIANMHIGIDAIKDWAKSGSDTDSEKYEVLYIDEGNIGQSDYSYLDAGLFVNGDIIVDGVNYKLSPKHRVVITGNPESYSKTRKTPNIILENGGVLKFEPIKLEALYANVMKSIFQPFVDKKDAIFWEKVSKTVLEVYQKINNISNLKTILTPRALQSISQQLRHMKDEQMLGKIGEEGADRDFTDKEMYNVILMNTQFAVPDECRPKLMSILSEKFNIHEPEMILSKAKEDALAERGFYITDSNKNLLIAIDNVIQLRKWKLNEKMLGEGAQAISTTKNKSVRESGGISGLNISGRPGLGKSASVRLALEANGFFELKLDDFDMSRTDQINNKQHLRGFVVMPNQATIQKKEKIAKWAFCNGIDLMLDEFNSAENALLEKSLNAYLCGKDLQGNSPKRPGFFIFATQNDALEFDGRFEPSEAMYSRMIRMTLYEHSKDDLIRITKRIKPKMKESDIVIFIDKYMKAKEYAENMYLTKPNFRDYLRVLDGQVINTNPLSVEPDYDVKDYIDPDVAITETMTDEERMIKHNRDGRKLITHRLKNSLQKTEETKTTETSEELRQELHQEIRKESKNKDGEDLDLATTNEENLDLSIKKPEQPQFKDAELNEEKDELTQSRERKKNEKQSSEADELAKKDEKAEAIERLKRDQDEVSQDELGQEEISGEEYSIVNLLINANQEAVKNLVAMFGFSSIADFIQNASGEDGQFFFKMIKDEPTEDLKKESFNIFIKNLHLDLM